MRIRADDAIAQFLLEPRHQRERDDHGHHPHRDAQRRDERNDGDERLLPLGKQIPERDVQLEGDIHHESYQPSAVSSRHRLRAQPAEQLSAES